MMDEHGFRKFLKRAGKKEHVVDGLVRLVQEYEGQLRQNLVGTQETREEQLREYAKSLPQSEVGERLRAVALYYKFTGNLPLAKMASDLREEEIAQTRRAFKLREFQRVRLEEVIKLEELGITTSEAMLAAGKTPQDRSQLAERSGVPPSSILELANLADLSRQGGMKGVRARLHYEAGLDTLDQFTGWEVESLRQMLVDFVERTGFDGIAPLPKEPDNAIDTARQLPPLVEY